LKKQAKTELAMTPGWLFKRFGQLQTRLSGGCFVAIAGAPDFFIYNDVVFTPDGEIQSIFGYPVQLISMWS
jgi:hypothetical protein